MTGKNVSKRAEWLIKLINNNNFNIGAEFGVGTGTTSRALMTKTDVTLIGVDCTKKAHWRVLQDKISALYGDRYRLIRDTTVNASNLIEDSSLDFVFVDAGHSYKAVCNDINNWYSKVKPGGCFCGHDYPMTGVKRAVNELLTKFSVDEESNIWYLWKGDL